MKKLLGIVVLGLILSISAKADNIKDFAIEDIYLDNNITNNELENLFNQFGVKINLTDTSKKNFYDSINPIYENNIYRDYMAKNNLLSARWKKDFETFVIDYEIVTFNTNVKNFDEIQLTFLSIDGFKTRALINISAVTNFGSARDCFKLKKNIEEDIVDLFKGAKRGEDEYMVLNQDKSERSKSLKTSFNISNTGNITLSCYDWDKDIVSKYKWNNKLLLNLNYGAVKLPGKNFTNIPHTEEEALRVFEMVSFYKKHDKEFNVEDKYFALLIANSNYRVWDNLKSPIKDVDEIANVLKNNYEFEVEILKNANRNEILDKLYEYSDKVNSNDNLLIYYSGHGEIINNNAFWIPSDGSKNISANWLNTSDVNSAISLINVKDLLVMVDSCYQGTAFKGNNKVSNFDNNNKTIDYFNKMLNYRSAIVVTSGRNEPVLDSTVNNHSAFAFKFIDILNKNEKFETGSGIFLELQMFHADLPQSPNIIRKVDWNDLGGEFVFVKDN